MIDIGTIPKTPAAANIEYVSSKEAFVFGGSLYRKISPAGVSPVKVLNLTTFEENFLEDDIIVFIADVEITCSLQGFI